MTQDGGAAAFGYAGERDDRVARLARLNLPDDTNEKVAAKYGKLHQFVAEDVNFFREQAERQAARDGDDRLARQLGRDLYAHSLAIEQTREDQRRQHAAVARLVAREFALRNVDGTADAVQVLERAAELLDRGVALPK